MEQTTGPGLSPPGNKDYAASPVTLFMFWHYPKNIYYKKFKNPNKKAEKSEIHPLRTEYRPGGFFLIDTPFFKL